METFELTNINRVAIPLKDGLPEKYAGEYGIPGAVQKHAYYGQYPLLFQEVKAGPYTLAISEYLTRNGSKITCRAKVVCIELHFLLTGKVLYNLKDLGWRGLDAGHHNIIALTEVKNETLFKITPVSTCDVHLTEDQVTQLSKTYPQLRPLIGALKNGGYASLFDLPPETTPVMLHLVLQIKEAARAGRASDPETIDMIGQLVIMALENKLVTSKYKYTYTDIEKIHKAHYLIGRYVEEKDILAKKLKESCIKADKFREGFRLLYGLLPSQYLLEKRLEKADWIIRGRRSSHLDDIAEMCGFKTAKQLSKDYQNKYGIKITDAIAAARNSH